MTHGNQHFYNEVYNTLLKNKCFKNYYSLLAYKKNVFKQYRPFVKEISGNYDGNKDSVKTSVGSYFFGGLSKNVMEIIILG